jgi:hypothetical protein
MAKSKNKAQRKVRLARSGGSAIPFENNQGAKLLIPGELTLAKLAEMGVSQIRLMPKGSPLPNGWWRDCDSPNEKAQPHLTAQQNSTGEAPRL